MESQSGKPGVVKQAMVSIVGLEQEQVEKLCRECGKGQLCQIANFLFPRGFSVGDAESTIAALEKRAREAGALQARTLKTNGAFHTPLMKEARTQFYAELKKVENSFRVPRCRVYMNSTGQA